MRRTAAASAALAVAGCARAADPAAVQRLKEAMHTLAPAEAAARLAALAAEAGPAAPRQSKIDHFVVLLMENHAADQMFGCMDLPGFDGLPKGGRLLPKDPADPSKGSVNVSCGTSAYVCPKGPGFSTFNGHFAPGANSTTYPYGEQNDTFSFAHGADGTAIEMFLPEQLPVKSAVAEHFGVFNKLYTAVPSASTPNHLFIQSATSCGIRSNIQYDQCGGPTATYPQMTIYDSLNVSNVSFALYINSTCGLKGKPACAGGGGTTPHISIPDIMLDGVARYKDLFMSDQHFYDAAGNGTLPAFSWLMPAVEACDHPCHDVAKGERLLKDVYEALRAGPKWDKTLFFVVYDDAGGYYDHVVPPHTGIPFDDAPCHAHCKSDFDFRRLGLRSTAMLISPWVEKGSVIQEPKGPTNTSQFELTSVPSTLVNLFNLSGGNVSGFLTKRDQWAGSFDELLLDAPRTDAPMHFPEAPPPAKPWSPPHDGGGGGGDGPEPQHCEVVEQVCAGAGAVTERQRRQAAMLAHRTGAAPPDLSAMTRAEANEWLAARWDEWMALPVA